MKYETTPEVEVAVAHYFNVRSSVIVPNVSWGMFPYELDLCVLNMRSFYAQEVEIKISRADLKRDSKKHHQHDKNGDLIRQLWFAMPEKLKGCAELVPERAGILLVRYEEKWDTALVYVERPAKINKAAKKWDYSHAFQLARLGTMRIFNLKFNVIRMSKENKNISSQLLELMRKNEANNGHQVP